MSAPVLWVKDGTRDLSVYGHTLTNSGVTLGKMELDGVDGTYINCGDTIPVSQQMTFSAWVNVNTQKALQIIAGYRDKDNWMAQAYMALVDDEIRIGYGDGSDIQELTSTENIDFDNGAWHFIVGTYDADNGIEKLYLNGELIKSLTGGDVITVNVEDSEFYIGSSEYNEDGARGRAFNGKLDDIRIYNHAMSADFINIEYLRTEKYY